MATRKRGSIIDAVTLEEVPFQYEPETKLKEETAYGTQKIIGRRLVNKVWVGLGSGEMDISFTLVGYAHTELNPTASEVGQFRYNQAVSRNVERKEIWVPDTLDGNGHVIVRGHYAPNPNYNPKMLPDGNGGFIENPNYKDPTGTVNEAKEALIQRKKQQNAKVNDMLSLFRQFLEPQTDTGAPHPVYVNMGKAYSGRKFIVHAIDSQVTVTNYATLEPMEATVKLTLSEIPFVAVSPTTAPSTTALTGKGQSIVGKKLKIPSMMPAHRQTVKAKTKRR